MKRGYIILGIVVLVAVVWTFFPNNNDSVITDFESCIAAGNPAMESYPRQCRDPKNDVTFVEVIEKWELDGIQLMKHETEWYYGCFGCSVPSGNSPAMCVDPIMEMKAAEETGDRYCNSDFEVVETESVCAETSRNVDVCAEIYQPVCAEVQVECITTPCDPVKKTYSNSCEACKNNRVETFVADAC